MDIDITTALIAFGGLGMLACTVGMQLTREKLVQVLIDEKSSASLDVSDWTFNPNGYTTVFAKGALWGRLAQQLPKAPRVQKFLLIARTLWLIRSTCFWTVIVTLGSYLLL